MEIFLCNYCCICCLISVPNVSFQNFAPGFVSRFLESHQVMLQGNAGLKPKEGEYTSRPWEWPINLRVRDCFFTCLELHANTYEINSRVNSSQAMIIGSISLATQSSGGATLDFWFSFLAFICSSPLRNNAMEVFIIQKIRNKSKSFSKVVPGFLQAGHFITSHFGPWDEFYTFITIFQLNYTLQC